MRTTFAQLRYAQRLGIGFAFISITFLAVLLVAVLVCLGIHYYHNIRYSHLVSYSNLESRLHELRMLEATNRRIRLQLMASTERISSLERELKAARAAAFGGRHRRSVFTPYLPAVTEIEEMGEPSIRCRYCR
jgi:hypothetical protein